VSVLLRSKQDLASLMPTVRAEMSKLDPRCLCSACARCPQFLNRTVSIYELGASMWEHSPSRPLLLAAVGIYGVLYFTVARRTKEIGIRMALGARYAQVLRMVLQRSLLWVAAGSSSAPGWRWRPAVTGQLVAGVSGADPLTFAVAVVIFLAIIVAACVVPARRAARVDPIQALRHE